MSAPWRLLRGDWGFATFSTAVSGAVERAVAEGAPPTVVVNVFGEHGITIGVNEDPHQVIDLALCAERGIPFRRRENGGGAIFAPKGSVNIALFVPLGEPGAPQTARAAFETLLPAAAAAIERRFAIPARYRPLNDIEVDGRKLVPCSTRLEHGVLVLRYMLNVKPADVALLTRLLPMPPEKVRDKARKGIAARFTCLEAEIGRAVEAAECEALAREIIAAVFPHAALAVGELTASERGYLAENEARLGADEWQFAKSEDRRFTPLLQPGDAIGRGREKAPGGMVWLALLLRDGRIVDAIVNGDFPPRPANAPLLLERGLAGTAAEPAAIHAVIAAFLADPAVEMAGVEVDHLMVAAEKALAAAQPI